MTILLYILYAFSQAILLQRMYYPVEERFVLSVWMMTIIAPLLTLIFIGHMLYVGINLLLGKGANDE